MTDQELARWYGVQLRERLFFGLWLGAYPKAEEEDFLRRVYVYARAAGHYGNRTLYVRMAVERLFDK